MLSCTLQNIFDRYVTYADFWIQDQEYRDPETGQLFDRSALNAELEKTEKPAGISNPKDFRNEIVNFVFAKLSAFWGKFGYFFLKISFTTKIECHTTKNGFLGFLWFLKVISYRFWGDIL